MTLHRMIVVLPGLVLATLLTPPARAGVPETAEYTVLFQATWSAQTHPVPSRPHFSPLVGGVHSESVSFWEEGGIATRGIEQMAELGATSSLASEINAAIASGHASHVILGDGVRRSPGSASLRLEVSREFPLVTLVSMLAPSPDWFAGVSGLALFESGNWVEQKVITLFTYDAGTDSGTDFNSPNRDTRPKEPIRVLDEGPFANGIPVGTFTFARVAPPPPAQPLFLNDGRFRVEVEWQDFDGNRGVGVPVRLTADTGYFWFFNEENVELVVKVLSGCSVNGHFWVFAGGLTSVEVGMRVEDTETGQAAVYLNALGEAFQPIQDTSAFATCP